ncbi:hypothetical protein HH308_19040 [Gordonia sp. TBRC 11910]|uniref:Uncharacterized protein n=1 Tax=Gordonia asplenii TaxID=2725283 RepID=A0A848L3Z3_9ACTN|nr:hypothetical protein [Gordonia asplenii]NMO03313.1 hypothetical protein [Gordonia asplenii]
MLSLAIATTLIGFALLVVGLITGQVWFAIICIAVCLIGVGLLVADVIRSGRRAKARTDTTDSAAFGDAEQASASVRPSVRTAPASDRAAAPSDDRWSPATQGASAVGADADRPDWATGQHPVQRGATAVTRAVDPAGAAGTGAAATEAASTEGTFTDYVAATSGNFPAQPTVTQPAPGDGESNFAQWPSYSSPDSSSPAVTASSSTPEPSTGASTTHPRESVTRSRRHASSGPVTGGSSGMPKFDPLDPDWHPPAE